VVRHNLASMFERIKKASRRRQIGVPVFLVVLGLAIWATKERGSFDGVTLLVGSLGLLLGLLQMIPARPKLKLTGRDDDPLIIFTPVVRPFDEDSIIKEQVSKALEAMPRRPAPEGSTASAFAYESRGLGPGRVGLRHSDETLRQHEGKISHFESRLQEWVTDLEAARAERLRLCEEELRLHELGYAPADHAHLRLFFPEGFELEDEAPSIDSPPDPPELTMEGQFLARRPELVLPIKGGIKLHHPDDEPHYSEKNGLPVVDYDLGRINQADHRDVPAFELKAPREPGRYEIEWEASAAGLNRPAFGTITFEVRAPEEIEAITTLAEAKQERIDFELY
jgi:hypothetical protein